MDDDTDTERDDAKRKSRNLSEKKRRDQFNLLVNELSSMVSATNRKMDKSTVLKSTIAFLRQHNEIAVRSRVHEIQEDWKPSFLSNEEFTHLILEALDGFIMVFSSTGRIYYASESITSLLGHLPSDLLNMTIYDLAYEEDHSDLYNLLLKPTNVMNPAQSDLTKENQITFCCHMKRVGIDYRDEISYELVQFVGYFRSNIDVEKLCPHNSIGFPGELDSKLLFVGTSRIQTPQLIREMSIIDSTKSEFTSRHSLEWKFLFLDHRAPPIIGYLPFEVLGTSGYDYYHFDDLERVVMCHEALMQKGEGTSCYYRFLTKGQQWIWLQTRFFITYHQWNSKPEFVVCTHRIVSYADVMKQLRNNNHNNIDGETTKDLDDSNSITEKRVQANSSSSMIQANSSWSSKSSRMSRSRHRHHNYQGNASDSTSMSADSPASKQSMTQYSLRSKIRHGQSLQDTRSGTQNQSPTDSDVRSTVNQQMTETEEQPSPSHSEVALHPADTHPETADQSAVTQRLQPHYHHHHHHHQIRPILPAPQILGSTFIDQQHYLAAIPVKPVLSAGFPAAASVISSIQPPPPEIMHPELEMSSSRTLIQDQLQRKHKELQQLIVQQQEELRRVSEQLLMTRYEILPSIVNVALPFNEMARGPAPRCNSGGNGSTASEVNRTINNSTTQSQQHQSVHKQQHQSNHQIISISSAETSTAPHQHRGQPDADRIMDSSTLGSNSQHNDEAEHQEQKVQLKNSERNPNDNVPDDENSGRDRLDLSQKSKRDKHIEKKRQKQEPQDKQELELLDPTPETPNKQEQKDKKSDKREPTQVEQHDQEHEQPQHHLHDLIHSRHLRCGDSTQSTQQ